MSSENSFDVNSMRMLKISWINDNWWIIIFKLFHNTFSFNWLLVLILQASFQLVTGIEWTKKLWKTTIKLIFRAKLPFVHAQIFMYWFFNYIWKSVFVRLCVKIYNMKVFRSKTTLLTIFQTSVEIVCITFEVLYKTSQF